jgi:hypothetical protein
MPYHEKPKAIAYSLHQQLVLAEVFLVDLQDLGVVDVAQQEEDNKEGQHDVDACESHYS